MSNPYTYLPPRSFWRSGVAEVNLKELRDVYRKRFEISKVTRIAAAGSCFAQHIGRQLRQRTFNYLDFEPPPPALPRELRSEYGYGLFSARYGNVYTARQLLQLVQRATGQFKPQTDHWENKGRYIDPFRPSVEPDGFGSLEELVAVRDSHFRAVRKLLERAQVFIFTLGLTEAWISKQDGAVYPVCPGTVAGKFDAKEHEFKNFRISEVLADMQAFIGIIRRINPDVKLLLTVSPVPLTATASDQHVLAATVYSKSVLRVVAGELYEEHDFVDYFPSYEIVNIPSSRSGFFEKNLRGVRSSAVNYVMSHFFSEHGSGDEDLEGRDASSGEEMPLIAQEDVHEVAVTCEEERLDEGSR